MGQRHRRRGPTHDLEKQWLAPGPFLPVLDDWRKGYEAARKELARVSDRVAARLDSVRNALAHVPDHARAHLRLASRLVDTLEIDDVLDLYQRSSGREPEIRFAILFAEKLQERVALPNRKVA